MSALVLRVGDAESACVLLCGSAVRQDGRSASLTAPNGSAQRALLLAALGRASLSPAEVGSVEAHGTGTSLGDPTEAGALAAVHDGAARTTALAVTAAKASVGHTEAASGGVGLLKARRLLAAATVAGNAQLRMLNPLVSARLVGLSAGFATPTQGMRAPSAVVACVTTALASLMLQRQNHLLLSDCDGPRRLVALCDSTEEMKALASGAMVLAVCAPTPEQRWDAYAEGRRIEVEEVHGLRALVRARQWVYGRAEAAAARAARAAHAKAQAVGASGMSTADAEAAGEAGLPPWLINPIRAMQMTQAQLDEEKKRLMAIGTAPSIALKQELVSREAHFVEVLTEVHADHIVTTSGKLQSLLYKVY